jgi:hypothetical protein
VRLRFYAYKDEYAEYSEPQLGLRWLNFKSDPAKLIERNRWRVRNNMPLVLDMGHDFTITLLLFKYRLTAELIIRPYKTE